MPASSPSPVLVFDLDGTILGVNSFPRWAGFLMIGRIAGLGAATRARLAWDTAVLIGRRKLRRMSHDELARELEETWHRYATPVAVATFQARLHRHVRPCMRPILGLVAGGQMDAVMATAAAADYAVGFGLDLGFRHVLATPEHRGPDEPMNVGPRKRQRVRDLLIRNGWQDRPQFLFTDHIDDLPLMRDSRLVCWYGPPRKMAEAQGLAPNARFIPCRDLSGEHVLAIVIGSLEVAPRAPQAAAAWWSLMAES
jgi:phosphoserine phosphatase